MGEVKIQKVEQRSGENVFIQTGEEIKEILLLNPQEKDRLVITFTNGEKLRIEYSQLIRALKNEVRDLYKKHKNLDLFMKICEKDEDFVKNFNEVYEVDIKFSELSGFFDITDYLFNNFKKIDRSTLTSQGLWVGNGIRKIQIDYDASEFLKLSESSKEKKKPYLLINKKNNDLLEKEITFEIKNSIIELDTDKFIDYLDENEKEADFIGYIVSHIEKDEYNFYQYCNFKIKITNPLFFAEDKDVVSIDFGTSSTCVAVDRGKNLISFTDDPKTIEDFENQTAIIIFNWRKIYEEWGVKSRTIPHFHRSKHRVDEVNIRNEHFNYSNYIKEELKEVPSVKTIDAIVTNLKSLPIRMESYREKDQKDMEYVIPFDGWKEKVFLTDDIEEENEERVNPIALYAYFIGRALNLQIENNPYLKYKLTMPVKFNEKLREKLRASIEYGLKRALPKALKDKVKVEIGYDESVALIGAAKHLKYFNFKDYDKEAFLFAVFDFGGGTLDFSFGLFRKAVKDERKVLEKENRYRGGIVEIFKTDGMKLGGEQLIEKLSYFIYKENKDKMKEKRIPIFVPEGEEKIDFFPKELFGERHIDKLNLRNINERISRHFFINGDSENNTANLFSLEDESKEIEVQLELSKEKMEEFLIEEVTEAVENFRDVLESVFNEYEERIKKFGFSEFDINEVRIFQAGNTCRSEWLKTAFDTVFNEHPHIIFLENKEEEVTVKNAVAKGALFLEGSGYHNHSLNKDGTMPLDRYVWNYEKLEDGEIEPVLKSGDNLSVEFKFIGTVNEDNTFRIYYSFRKNLEDIKDEHLMDHLIEIPEELIGEDNFFVFAKPYDGKVIELAFAEDEEVESELEGSILLDLESGDIRAKNG